MNIHYVIFCKMETVCEHVIFDGTCSKCGIVINNIIGITSAQSRKDSKSTDKIKSILNDVKKLGFIDEIARAANVNYLESGIPLGKRNRNAVLFFFIYYACIECGRPETPNKIAEVLGISKNNISEILQMDSGNYKPPIVHYSPLDLIPLYCNRLYYCNDFGKPLDENGKVIEDAINEYDRVMEDNPKIRKMLKDDKNNIMQLAQRILNKDQSLKDEPPIKICAAIIQYYMDQINMNYNKKGLAVQFGLSRRDDRQCSTQYYQHGQ